MSRKLIVLIDNNLEDLRLLERSIRTFDRDAFCISFIFADEAIYTITQYLRQTPDVIFLNANTKRITGPECLARLRQLDALSHCRIIMFSGMMPAAVGESFLKLGASYYFQTPAGASQYQATIGEVFRNLSAA